MRRDQFYGVPLATAIREYLQMRRASNLGPATVNDIHAALVSGGFVFETRNEANAKRALYISLGKNTLMFHKLPSGTDATAVFGLKEWYPRTKEAVKPKRKSRKVRTKPKATPTVSNTKSAKGVAHEESPSVGPAARKKHNLTLVA
jgi:hypothetical protein